MVYHGIAGDGISGLLSYRGTGALSVTRRSSRRSGYGVGYGVATDGTSGLLLVEVPGRGR